MAISSVLGKILDHIIIEKQSEALKTCNYQFGFKAKSSTVLCSTMVNETVQYYTENAGKPVYVLLLDASKAFDNGCYSRNCVIVPCVHVLYQVTTSYVHKSILLCEMG